MGLFLLNCRFKGFFSLVHASLKMHLFFKALYTMRVFFIYDTEILGFFFKQHSCNVSSTFFGRQEEKLDVKNEKVEFIFPNCFSRLQPNLFLPRPYYYFSSVFCPEMFQNLLFFWKKQTFIVFPREGRNFFVPQVGNCCPSGG